jgi:hypothetical protein
MWMEFLTHPRTRLVLVDAIARRLALGAVLVLTTSTFAQDRIEFNRDIRPILSENCFQCHGPDERQRQGGIRLDRFELATQPGDSGKRAIDVEHAAESELLQRVFAETPDGVMPPPETGKTLQPSQKALLRRWIEHGAEYQGHWAFITPVRPEVPLPELASVLPNPIDRFLLKKLRAEGFSFSPQADRETLIRRLSLDLVGLPPTIEQIEDFLSDASPNAYERVVDRLLSSPHYGERMALQWLDLARYADSNGFQIDSSRQQWPWRDWVIDAFNRNMPYDQFTIEQIAGDLLPDATLSQKVATGFNRNHRLNGEGGIIAEEWRVETVIDRVETTGMTWLALTLNCCRCHDHKYDPISQRDFYSFFSYFNNIAESGTLQGESRNTEPVVQVPSEEQLQQSALYEMQLRDAELALRDVEKTLPELVAAWEPGFREKIASTTTAWNFLNPDSASAASGAALTKQSDGAYLVSGQNPTHDVYEITSPLSPGRFTGLLLECFPDPSLPQQSLGRYPNGNFVLTRVEAVIRASTLAEPWTAKFTHAEADYSQKGWEIQNTVQGNPSKGWAVDGPSRKEICRAMFLTETGIDVPPEATITIRLVQESLAQHNIGRFRLAATGLPKGTIAIGGSQVPDSLRTILALPSDQRSDAQRLEVQDFYRKSAEGPIQAAEKKVQELNKQLTEYRNRWPNVMVMQEIAQPREAFILIRGEYDKRGEPVAAALPKVFPPLPDGAPNNRLGLARWIADRNHPLTARVWVNRMWERLMGVGIVKTTENFGSQAEWPSHPELLDWLAVEFMEPSSGLLVNDRPIHPWDMKGLLKRMVMSRAYQQSASRRGLEALVERDPDNRWLGRGPRFRLPGEVLRDQALHVSGLLSTKLGGQSARPYMPDGVWDETSVYGDLRNYKHDPGEGLYRRSLYTVWKRTAAPPSMLIFDAPSREICTVSRSRTNTPLQALSLMNEVTFVEAARKLGERMMKHSATTPEGKLTYGFRLATGRKPTEQELHVLVSGWRDDMAYYEQHADEATQLLRHGDSASEATSPAELVAFMLSGNVLLNLDESIMRE